MHKRRGGSQVRLPPRPRPRPAPDILSRASGREDSSADADKHKSNERHSPNTAHVLADFTRVRPLKLAQLRIALNLEEHFLARLGDDLHASKRNDGTWLA